MTRSHDFAAEVQAALDRIPSNDKTVWMDFMRGCYSDDFPRSWYEEKWREFQKSRGVPVDSWSIRE